MKSLNQKLLYNAKEYITFRAEKSESLSPPAGGDKICDTLYPKPKKGRGVTNTIHLLIMPRLFKEILMLCNTDKGKQVRSFYLNMVDVFELYTKYQNKLIVTTLEQKLDKMSLTLVESNQKADDERKRSEEERKRSEERFNALMNRTDTIQDTLEETREDLLETQEDLLETQEDLLEKVGELKESRTDTINVVKDRVSQRRVPNNKQNYIVILKDDDEKEPYYIMRIQEKYINLKIARERRKSPNIREIFRMYMPNAINAWLSICNRFPLNIKMSRKLNRFSIAIVSEEQLINNIRRMDNDERKNPKFI